jgi:hypothetical protein
VGDEVLGVALLQQQEEVVHQTERGAHRLGAVTALQRDPDRQRAVADDGGDGGEEPGTAGEVRSRTSSRNEPSTPGVSATCGNSCTNDSVDVARAKAIAIGRRVSHVNR